MSTTRTDYIILGYKLRYGFFEDQGIDLDSAKYDDPTFWPDKYKIINDGMNGEYIVFGEVIQQADEYEGLEFYEAEAPGDDQLNAIDDMFRKLFGDAVFFSISARPTPKLLIFTHWS